GPGVASRPRAVGQVDDLLVTARPDAELVVARQHLVDGDPVEASEALQARYGDRPLATLVGPQDRCLELVIRCSLDVLQREVLLSADRTKSGADLGCVAVV